MFNGNAITESNRSELSVSTSYLMNEQRMVNGTLRRYVVANKRTWQLSWQDLFSKASFVIDGAWSGEEMRTFYNDLFGGSFELTIYEGEAARKTVGENPNPVQPETVLVMFQDFNWNIVKREGRFDIWNLDVSLVEV
jgi:hypothetical protein